MKPDWDALGSEYADSKTVVIADVDCTAAGKPLCEKYGVRGYPTIKCAYLRCPSCCLSVSFLLYTAPTGRACASSASPYYPVCRYFNPPDEEGEDYKGGRSLDDLKKFAANELGPGCSVDALENCSEAQKKELEEYITMPAEERASMLDKLKDELKTAESKHEALLKELQATYKESMDALEKLKETSAPKIKLLKAASPAPKAAETAAPKDEV